MSEEKKSLCRVVHNRNYTTINNHICKDNRISYKAEGIWLYAFSRPDDWQFYLSDIINQSTDGKDSVRSGLEELENAGYLKRERKRGHKNLFCGWIYTFFEIPLEIQKISPTSDFPEIGKSGDREKPPLLSTDVLLSTEQQQQQPPIGGSDVVVFDDLIKKIGLDEKDKKSIRSYMNRTKLKSEDLANAIDFVIRPEFVIKESLVKALMWALKEKPKLPDPIDIEANQKIATLMQDNLESKFWTLEALSTRVSIYSKTPNNPTTHEIKYIESGFKERLIELLKQLKFSEYSLSL